MQVGIIATFNAQTMKSWIITLILFLFGVRAAHAGDKRALLIGISQYPSQRSPELTWSPIHGANDVALIKKTLQKQGYAVTTLTNANATASNIRSAFVKLEKQVKPDDIVYIHFSGHGQAYEDASGDEADGWDEAIVPYDAMLQFKQGVYDGSRHILDDELEQYLTVIRKKAGKNGHVYVVLDACHMGGASRGDEMEEDELFIRGTDKGFSPTGKKYIPKIDRRGNMRIQSHPAMASICIIEACRAYQTNAEIKQGGQYFGPLTYYINQTLQNVRLSSDTGWVETVRSFMGKDRRLIKQNMVTEKSN